MERGSLVYPPRSSDHHMHECARCGQDWLCQQPLPCHDPGTFCPCCNEPLTLAEPATRFEWKKTDLM
jgi:hypothetical protein